MNKITAERLGFTAVGLLTIWASGFFVAEHRPVVGGTLLLLAIGCLFMRGLPAQCD